VAFLTLGLARLNTGDPERALSALQIALRSPDHENVILARMLRFAAYSMIGDIDQADAELRAVREVRPEGTAMFDFLATPNINGIRRLLKTFDVSDSDVNGLEQDPEFREWKRILEQGDLSAARALLITQLKQSAFGAREK